MRSLFHVLQGHCVTPPPLWMMRQAGRYLPEYRALRAGAPSFLDFCLTPSKAIEVTLQPIRRFGFDAAILFSDILVIPHAIGHGVVFVEGEGPKLDVMSEELSAWRYNYDSARLDAVYETVRGVRAALPHETTLLGFCGGLFTVAAYMIDGTSKTGFPRTHAWINDAPERLDALLGILEDASVDYLSKQLSAGADAVQIFESWAGVLDDNPALFDRFITRPTARMVGRIRETHPAAPVIGFPRAAPNNIESYTAWTGINAVGLSTDIALDQAASLQRVKPVQGFLDPLLLVQGGDSMHRAIDSIMNTLSGGPFIFNLGHGILPETPLAHVEDMLRRVKG